MRVVWSLMLAGLFLGTIGIFTKLIGPNISPFLLAFLRAILVPAIIFVFLLLTKNLGTLRIQRKHMMFYLAGGIFGVAVCFILYIKSLTLVPVANAVFLLYIYPVVTAMLAFLFLKERINKQGILAIVLMLMGTWLIYGTGISFSFGNVLALLAGISQSVWYVVIRYMEKREKLKFWNTVFWTFLIGGIFMIPVLPFETIAFNLAGNTPYYLAGLVFVSTFLGYALYAVGLKTVHAHNAPVVVLVIEISSAVILAWAILGELLPQYIYFGGILIAIAAILVGLDIRKKQLMEEA